MMSLISFPKDRAQVAPPFLCLLPSVIVNAQINLLLRTFELPKESEVYHSFFQRLMWVTRLSDSSF